ncbi:MAG: ATP-binding cassette domain-containing protein [Chloroflexi bacterium]|nr:ATP-binding cassette domain-containing protein [Chloroflexota bacterium]
MHPSNEPVVEARGLTKRYGEMTAVDAIDFTIEPRTCFGFLGPNGAGKSSTMRMLYCVSPPTEGELRVLGLDVRREPRRIKARLGVVPQEDNLDPDLTVLANLLTFARYFDLPKKLALTRAHEALDLFALADRAGSSVAELSGGMKRRLVIARALINAPDLLILDEPTTGLDPQARHLVWQKLRYLRSQGVSLVLTTHYMDEAQQLCDRLVVIDRARILAEGPPLELIDRFVGLEVLELGVTDETAVPPLRDELDRRGHAYEERGDTLYLYSRAPRALADLPRELEPFVERATLRRASLEDVFLKLAGHELRD